MYPRLLLFSIVLPLFFSTAAWADEPIREIEGVQSKAAAFDLGGAEKPLMIQSADEAAKHFDAENLATLKKEVDFSKQKVLLFAWRGSGQDRIEYVVLESFPEQVRFSYQRGRTEDLRQHVKVFVLRSNVKYGFNGKPAPHSKNEKEKDERLPGGVLGLVRVLSDDAVKSAVMLDKDQVAVVSEVTELLGQVRDGKAQAMASDRLRKSLREDQLARLEQIHWQRLGARAIYEKQVRQGLDLTDEQQQKLQEAAAVNDAENRKMLDFLRRARFRSREAMDEYKQGYFDAADGRLLDVLTAEQRDKLKVMAGKPFVPKNPKEPTP